MDRKYIKDLLNCPCVIHRISKGKTQCSHNMTEFYFFQIFFEALKNIEIIASLHYDPSTVINIEQEEPMRYIMFRKGNDELKVFIDEVKLRLGLIKYNNLCAKEDTSFMDSALLLIKIFTDLLG